MFGTTFPRDNFTVPLVLWHESNSSQNLKYISIFSPVKSIKLTSEARNNHVFNARGKTITKRCLLYIFIMYYIIKAKSCLNDQPKEKNEKRRKKWQRRKYFVSVWPLPSSFLLSPHLSILSDLPQISALLWFLQSWPAAVWLTVSL